MSIAADHIDRVHRACAELQEMAQRLSFPSELSYLLEIILWAESVITSEEFGRQLSESELAERWNVLGDFAEAGLSLARLLLRDEDEAGSLCPTEFQT